MVDPWWQREREPRSLWFVIRIFGGYCLQILQCVCIWKWVILKGTMLIWCSTKKGRGNKTEEGAFIFFSIYIHLFGPTCMRWWAEWHWASLFLPSSLCDGHRRITTMRPFHMEMYFSMSDLSRAASLWLDSFPSEMFGTDKTDVFSIFSFLLFF